MLDGLWFRKRSYQAGKGVCLSQLLSGKGVVFGQKICFVLLAPLASGIDYSAGWNGVGWSGVGWGKL